MNAKLDWHNSQAITFEYLKENYSYGDLVFEGLRIDGILDGVLHIGGFQVEAGNKAKLSILFKNIRKIVQHGEVDLPTFTYDIEVVDSKKGIKRLILKFYSGTMEIEFSDELLYIARLSTGELTTL